jgi:hypothetical protein
MPFQQMTEVQDGRLARNPLASFRRWVRQVEPMLQEVQP